MIMATHFTETARLAASAEVPPFFILLTLVFGSVVVISLILNKLKQSLLVGYFLCGLAIANSGVVEALGLENTESISVLSELGVVLLLFTLGIEFSVKELTRMRSSILIGGGIQIGLTALVATVVVVVMGMTWAHALIIGCIVALSSTAVSMKCFQEMMMSEAPQAKATLGVAIAQDLVAIFFMVLIPVLAGGDDVGGGALMAAMAKGIFFTVSILILSRYGFPQILDAVAKTRSRELFTITVVGLCAVVALLSGLLGLSPALGAFAAGVVVSESIYSHRILSDILPFKDLFLTVFFVSIGLMIDVETLQQQWVAISVLTVATIVVKGLIAGVAARCSGLRWSQVWITAASLASTGEFSIVLLDYVSEYNIISEQWSQVLLASAAISMGLVPTLMKTSVKLRLRKRAKAGTDLLKEDMKQQFAKLEDHVIICGYGPVGRNLHAQLINSRVQAVIVDMNPDVIKSLQRTGHKAIYGDISDEIALQLAHVETARSLVMTFPNVGASVKTASHALAKNPKLLLYARARFSSDVLKLESAGFQHILHDEEMSGRALNKVVMNGYSSDFDDEWGF